MRLMSATVRNYRIHDELTVRFDDARTLLGGPNESGKSTFIEAVHHGLFLKSTVTGETQRDMLSLGSSAHPEVEITFSAGGREYEVKKRFSGQSGRTQLSERGGETWQGDEAESRLAALLAVEEVAGGRGIGDRIANQWAHLWVWQGKAGNDPRSFAALQRDDLLRQLQQSGASAVFQSELDAKVAAAAEERKQASFTIRGVRKGSDLDRATVERDEAEEGLQTAQGRLDRLQRAVQSIEEAEATIASAGEELSELDSQQTDLTVKMQRIGELAEHVRKHREEVQQASETREALREAEQSIADLGESIDAGEKAMAPLHQEKAAIEEAIEDCRARRGEVGEAYASASARLRQARLRLGLSSAYVDYHERCARLEELEKQLARVQDLRTRLTQITDQLAETVDIDEEDLDRLFGLRNDLEKAEASRDAMAAEIEVIAAPQGVVVGEEHLLQGTKRTIAEAATVRIGDDVELRLLPGGGDSLSDARERAQQLKTELRVALDGYGLQSVDAAVEALRERTELLTAREEAMGRLEELNADDVEIQHDGVRLELAQKEADIDRRRSQLDDPAALETLDDAKQSEKEHQEASDNSEAEEQELLAERESLAGRLDQLIAERDALQAELDDGRRGVVEQRALLKAQVEKHGDDGERGARPAEAEAAVELAQGALSDAETNLDAEQPEFVEKDATRLARAIEAVTKARQEAETRKAVSEAELRLDGTADPNADLANARARAERAERHWRAVSRKARAFELLDRLFKEEQGLLSEQLATPLAEKIDLYLSCLFGPEARADVSFEDNAVAGIRLARGADAPAITFGALSGGSREQVAAAVRLAIADLLAADHDGALPVVFDDAFAYSDPERIQMLQRMLDQAADNGLQIVVLTCNPTDYSGLGAERVQI